MSVVVRHSRILGAVPKFTHGMRVKDAFDFVSVESEGRQLVDIAPDLVSTFASPLPASLPRSFKYDCNDATIPPNGLREYVQGIYGYSLARMAVCAWTRIARQKGTRWCAA